MSKISCSAWYVNCQKVKPLDCETHNFNCQWLTPVGSPHIINLQTESNYMAITHSLIQWPICQDFFDCKWSNMTDPLTHPSTQPVIHPPIGGSASTNHKSSNKFELCVLGQDLFDFCIWTWLYPSTHPTKHPS